MTDTVEYCDVALLLPSSVTLARMDEVFRELSENEIDVNYCSFSFTPEGLSFVAECDSGRSDIADVIDGIADVELDLDTMADWMDE